MRSQLSGLISASRFKCGITERVDVGWGCTMLGVWMSDNGLGCWVGGCRVGGGCREDAALKSWQLLWSLAGFRPFLNSARVLGESGLGENDVTGLEPLNFTVSNML